ncbi:ABC transporter ATP-binding protein [Selenihalanaerobacter shriftii]|uniref:Tungstate transport system ATP-binding protein n=1 Tax=Selenihalanaerobacter shriftii TaxID=142842 RepID=A0A1T4PAB4_9FIRM|nr:ABC transporter ATP-binding protein [Selenihalanaerobacter shriftii]SJZ88483.1 tungstate transport system ATP-binding protein [Selenihalanaerobacter shriftii]
MKNITETVLEAERITKHYGDEQVLDLDHFKLYENAFNLLLGSNGSGKTTLLRILSLIDKEYEGQLRYRGEVINKQESELLKLRRRFSVIWQEPYLYNGTIAENIGLPLKLRKVAQNEINNRVNKLASNLKISHLLKKDSKEISGGEKQKVSIARALIVEPEILFIDEPTTHLDYKSNQFFNELFTELVAEGMTILLITHDLYQIKYLADYITLMESGEVVISDIRKKVLDKDILGNNNIIS